MNRYDGRPGYWKRTNYEGFVTDIFYPYHERKRSGKLYEDEHIVNQVQHNLGVVDSLVAFYPYTDTNTGKPILTAWERGEKTAYHERLRPDAWLKLYGVEFFDEEECGNHPLLTEKQYQDASDDYRKKSFNYKISRYIHFLSEGNQDKHVMIRVQKWIGRKYDRSGTDELFDQILEYLTTIGKYRQNFIVAKHRDVSGDLDHTEGEIHHDDMGDPLGAVWFTPADPNEPTSIQAYLQRFHI